MIDILIKINRINSYTLKLQKINFYLSSHNNITPSSDADAIKHSLFLHQLTVFIYF